MKTINTHGDSWKVLSLGVRDGGKVYAHLASLTRGRQQKNGWIPVQMCDWIDESLIQIS
jgi:hypothetical protein